MDNLKTHNAASLYETFEPAEARRRAERLEIHHTPKHGSWLNIAEIELSALNGQCLDRLIATLEEMRTEIMAWQVARNNRGAPVKWLFTTENAKVSLGQNLMAWTLPVLALVGRKNVRRPQCDEP